MDVHSWLAIGILVVAVVLFVTRWIPWEVTALSLPVVLAATGTLVHPEEALKGFGNHAVLAIAAIFVVGAGIRESGVATLMARGFARLGGESEGRLVFLVMGAVCMLSAVMPNAATVAVFLPAVSVLGRRTHISSSRLMMPLAYAATLGGTLTLIGTGPNLVLGEEMRLATKHPMGVFAFTPVGAAIAVVGILYMIVLGRRLLPQGTEEDRLRGADLPEELAKNYAFVKNLYRMRVVPGSRVAGKSIDAAAIGNRFGLEVVLIQRPGSLGGRYIHPRPGTVLETEDQIYLEGDAEAAWRFAEEELLQFGLAGPMSLERILGRGVGLAEVTLSPHSGVYGKTLKDLRFRTIFGLNAISLWRRGRPITGAISDTPLGMGDALLVSGPVSQIADLSKDPDYIVLTDQGAVEDVRRAPLAVLLVLLAILPAIFGWLPLAVSALAAALLMVVTGCASLTGARRAVDLRILALLVGTIPLGIALNERGVARIAAHELMALQHLLGPWGVLAGLFVVAAVLSSTTNNAATAVILAPVAAQAAHPGDLTILQTFLAVAYGASCAFLLPFASQCNLMVTGPGNYRDRDFFRVGLPLSVLMAVTSIALLTLL